MNPTIPLRYAIRDSNMRDMLYFFNSDDDRHYTLDDIEAGVWGKNSKATKGAIKGVLLRLRRKLESTEYEIARVRRNGYSGYQLRRRVVA